jgi:excisionase family DNA binding protein
MNRPSDPGADKAVPVNHRPGPLYPDDALLTLAQAADVLNVSYSTVTKWTARGEFCPAAFKLPNGRYRVRYRDLMRWALSLRASA